MVGVVPLFAVAVPVREGITRSIDPLRRDALGFLARHADALGSVQVDADDPRRSIVAIADEDRLRRILRRLFDESEFLSPHGLRSLSAAHREVYELWMDGRHLGSVRYEPAESASGMFGGNSNWRGPVWFPVNYLLIESLLRYHRHHGDDFTVEYPTGSGRQRTLRECARDLQHRLVSTFLPGPDGRRPVFGDATRFHTDPVFRDSILFYEYFHGDDGAGIGASHQTGWTGLVADMIVRLSNARAAGEPGV
jgi:hypothetical protein